MLFDRISADVPAIVAHLREGTPVEGEQNKKVLRLAKRLSSPPTPDPDEDSSSLDDRSIEILTENLHHVAKIFSNENPIEAALQDPEELPRLFRLAVREETATKEEVGHIFEGLVHLAGCKELGEEAIVTILQDTKVGVKKGLLDEENAFFSIWEEENEIPINMVALCAKSEGLYHNITETGIEGESKEELALPEKFGEMLKGYVEENRLPTISGLYVRALAHAYTFLEGNLFPEDITDHFLGHLIEALEEEQPEVVGDKDRVSRERKLPEKELLQTINAALPALINEQGRNVKNARRLLENLHVLLRSFDKEEYSKVIDAIQDMEPEERQGIIEEALPYIESIDNVFLVTNFIRAVGELSEEQREDTVLTPLFALLRAHPDGEVLISCITQFPKGERGNVIRLGTPLLQTAGETHEVVGYLDAIADIDSELREKAIAEALQATTYQQRMDVLLNY